ncbi:MAG: M15 family metallopeptidase [Clostridia bacterium]|nr:M15 family metallopeptidase [Clostridia bacterium]
MYGNIYGVAAGDCTVTVSSVDNPAASAAVAVHVKEKPAETTSAPAETASPPAQTPPAANGVTYIDGILIANKTYALPADYDPGVDATAYAALMEMFAGAYAEGITLWVASGYRSYDTQAWLYNNYVAMDGKAAADTYSARPGHSEHQTGLAFDLNYVADYFASTPEGIWLAANCWKYGFIIRYPAGKESITGYKYEPWHVRYLGKDVAKKVYESGLCLEEYLGITSVYSY